MRQFFKAIGVDVLKTQPVMAKGGSMEAPWSPVVTSN